MGPACSASASPWRWSGDGLLRLKRALPMPPAAYLAGEDDHGDAVQRDRDAHRESRRRCPKELDIARPRAASIWHDPRGDAAVLRDRAVHRSRVSGRVAPARVNLVYLPMIYLSGLFFPMPESIRPIVLVSPAFHLNQLALQAAGIAGDSCRPRGT